MLMNMIWQSPNNELSTYQDKKFKKSFKIHLKKTLFLCDPLNMIINETFKH